MKSLAISSMSTRNVANLLGRAERCTSFQLYAGKEAPDNVIDFTERRLIRYAEKVQDPQQKLVLMALIHDYINGHVAVAWRRGLPVPIRVTKDT